MLMETSRSLANMLFSNVDPVNSQLLHRSSENSARLIPLANLKTYSRPTKFNSKLFAKGRAARSGNIRFWDIITNICFRHIHALNRSIERLKAQTTRFGRKSAS